MCVSLPPPLGAAARTHMPSATSPTGERYFTVSLARGELKSPLVEKVFSRFCTPISACDGAAVDEEHFFAALPSRSLTEV